MPCGATCHAILALSILGCGGGPPPTTTPVGTTLRLEPVSLEPFSLRVSGKVLSVGQDEVTGRYECRYTLTVAASGGAPPNDVGTWAPSEIEFIDALGNRSKIEVSEVEMVDRFGSLEIRSGGPKTTSVRVAENSTPDFSLIFRIRHMVGEQLRSQSVPLACR